MERRAGLENGVDGCQRFAEGVRLEERTVARRVHVCEIEDRAHPARLSGDLDDVVDGAEVAHAAHDLDAERHRTILAFEAFS